MAVGSATSGRSSVEASPSALHGDSEESEAEDGSEHEQVHSYVFIYLGEGAVEFIVINQIKSDRNRWI